MSSPFGSSGFHTLWGSCAEAARLRLLGSSKTGLEKLRHRILNNVLSFHKKDVPVQSRTRE